MNDAIGSAAISAAGSLVGTAVDAIMGQNVNASKKVMDHQFYLNKQMWDLNNEYNLPTNQVERLKAAGLNPNLVYGNGANTVSPLPSGVGTSGLRAHTGFSNVAAAGINTYLQSKLNDSTIKVNDAAASAHEADAANKRADLPGHQAEAISKVVKSDVDEATKQDLINKIKNDTEASYENVVQQREKTLSMQNENSLFDFQKELLFYTLQNAKEGVNLTRQQINTEIAKASSLFKEAQKLQSDYDLNQKRIKEINDELSRKPDANSEKRLRELKMMHEENIKHIERDSKELQLEVDKDSYAADVIYRYFPMLKSAVIF